MAKNKLNIILGIDARALERSLGQVQRRLNRFASSLQSTGRTLTESLTVPLAGIGAAAVSTFAQFDKLEKGFAAIGGSAEEGKRQLDSLLNIVKATNTTLDLQNAAKVTLQLRGVGLAAEDAERLLRGLAIAATATGQTADDVGEVGRQLSQSLAKGKVFQQELNILFDRLPGLARVVKDEFGAVTAEGLRDAGVSAQEFIQRLTVAIEKDAQLANVQGGLSKAIESFGIELQIAGKELGETIAKSLNLEQNLTKVSEAIAGAVKWFKSLTPEAQKFIVKASLIAAAIGPVLLILGKLIALGPLLVGAFKNIISTVRSVGAAFTIANLKIFAIIAIVAGVIAGLVALYNRFEGVRRVVNAVIDVFAELGKIAQESFSALLQGFADLKEGNFRAAAGNFSKAVANVLPGRALGQRLGAALAEGYADESNRIEAGLEALKKRVFSTVEEFTGAAGAVVQSTGSTSGTGTGTGTGAAQKIGIADETVINIPIEFDEEAKVQVDEFALALDRNVSAAARYSDAINLAQQNARIFGTDGLGLVRAELDATKSTIDALLSEGYSPYSDTIQNLGLRYQELTAQIQLAEQQQATLQERMQSVTNLVGGALGQAFTDFFTAIETGGKNAFQSLLDGLKNALISIVKQLAVALIKAIAVAAVLSIVFPNSTSVSGAGKAASQLGSLFKSFAGLADGGIIPPGFPNDTFPARLSSGEAVIPLDKLDRYTGGQTVFIPNLTIKGQDFVIAFEKAKASYNRYS